MHTGSGALHLYLFAWAQQKEHKEPLLLIWEHSGHCVFCVLYAYLRQTNSWTGPSHGRTAIIPMRQVLDSPPLLKWSILFYRRASLSVANKTKILNISRLLNITGTKINVLSTKVVSEFTMAYIANMKKLIRSHFGNSNGKFCNVLFFNKHFLKEV